MTTTGQSTTIDNISLFDAVPFWASLLGRIMFGVMLAVVYARMQQAGPAGLAFEQMNGSPRLSAASSKQPS